MFLCYLFFPALRILVRTEAVGTRIICYLKSKRNSFGRVLRFLILLSLFVAHISSFIQCILPGCKFNLTYNVKYMQWFTMKRQHAIIVMADSLYYTKFRDYCRVRISLFFGFYIFDEFIVEVTILTHWLMNGSFRVMLDLHRIKGVK